MTPDEHQRERMHVWFAVYAQFRSVSFPAHSADEALAEFDKRFPAPSAAAPVEPGHWSMGYEIASLRQKARLWDAVASGKVVLLYDDRELFAGRYDKEDSIGWQTGWFNTAEEAVEAAIAAGALK